MVQKDKWGTHQAHCCSKHGCKYGDRDCPVVLHSVDQEYQCEECSDEEEHFSPIKIEINEESTKVYANGVLIGIFQDYNEKIKIFKPIDSFDMCLQQHFFLNDKDLQYYLQSILEQIRKIF